MSFATLSETLEECSLISKLELNKNPFDSEMEDRLNLPAMSSPSIFSQQQTPGSQKKKEFRWSIDQMSKLNPADIDEFPNQEYSSVYERSEDETKAQEAINEYFSHGTILPSPWTPENHAKHVTFSPLPPSTAYISGEEDSMTDVSHASSNTSGRQQTIDAGFQTSLTFPPSFDLSKILDSGFYSYVEEEEEEEESLGGRDLNVSSLRRKLFSQDDNGSPTKPAAIEQSSKEKATRSILKSPSSMTSMTSSPLKNHRSLHPDLDSLFSSSSKGSLSPLISPIKPPATMGSNDPPQEVSVNGGTLSNDEVFTSDIFESSDVCIDLSHVPDVSPIKDPGTTEQHENPPDRDETRDGGPMKISDLSNVEMDYEDEDPNNNSTLEIAEPRSSTLTDPRINPTTLVSNSEGTGKQHVVLSDVVNHQRHEVIAGMRDDVIDDASLSVKEKRSNSHGSNVGGLFEESEMDCMGSDGRSRRRGVMEDNWGSKKENIEGCFHGDYVDLDDLGFQAEEALLKRATAAINRADKLVLETSMEQGRIPRKTSTSTRLLNWRRVDGSSQWHPIDMSTPLVSGGFTKPPFVLKTADSSLHRRHLSEHDSYNNLLSSFANSRLDQGPRSFGPAASQDSGLGTIFSSENGSRNQARTMGLEARARRSLGSSRSQDLPRDICLSGRNNYSGTPVKRYSWPPWRTSRTRYPYLSSRTTSPRIPCGIQPRQRHRAMAEERSKTRRSDELKRFTKPTDHQSEKYADYFDGMHSNLRKYHNCR